MARMTSIGVQRWGFFSFWLAGCLLSFGVKIQHVTLTAELSGRKEVVKRDGLNSQALETAM